MRVALVHYWLTKMRGGERVLEALAEMFPDADIFTHVYDPAGVSDALKQHTINTTYISKLPFARSQYQKYLPFMPRALEELDLSAYDLIISSESGPAKGVIPRPDAFHLCYCHSPMRYIWDLYPSYRESSGFFARLAFPHIAHKLRTWDVTSAARVDQFVANSNFVAKRIEKYYRRSSEVVAPAIDIDEFASARKDMPGDYFLAAGEFVGYKRFDIAVEAFNQLGLPLVIVGDGEGKEALMARAKENIKFVGRVGFKALKEHFGTCQALVFPGEEDFGMIPVEVMAAGRPVIAYARGGALDSVVGDKTGILFQDQTVEGLVAAVKRFQTMTFNPDDLQAHARGFDKVVFKQKITGILRQHGIEI